MSHYRYPRNNYGAARFVDYSLISSANFEYVSQNTAHLSAQNRTSGNLDFSYPTMNVSATCGAVSITQLIPFFYDMATQQLGEAPYYVINPMFCRLYWSATSNLPSFSADGQFSEFSMKLKLLPYFYSANYYYTVLALKAVASNGETVQYYQPVAIKPNSLQILNAGNDVVTDINNQPASSATTAAPNRLPDLACCWYIPSLPSLGGGERYACREVYSIMTLDSFEYKPEGYVAGADDLGTGINGINNYVRPTNTLAQQFNDLTDAAPNLYAPFAPNLLRDPQFFVNNFNLLQNSPYASNNGALTQIAGQNTTTAYTEYDFQSAVNYKVTASMGFKTLRVPMFGAIA